MKKYVMVLKTNQQYSNTLTNAANYLEKYNQNKDNVIVLKEVLNVR